jgi:hypothetical protein
MQTGSFFGRRGRSRSSRFGLTLFPPSASAHPRCLSCHNVPRFSCEATELDRVSQTLTGRIRVLAERYAKPLPTLESDVEALSAKVEAHLKRMGHSIRN